ncbi:arginine decarboxylase, pyruvoyl-dependent [Metallumcola ferriviriculae]|uniref:Pyruvoyl-dependent arginine decarboxylase AaxB n=2 Tax=Metallumcola ferriviriculae TaxID=3039180 RepID=A0AAU0USX2_9FIRM|nr:arginine decarboxylase, pyruvoyl-dependent [Desulfitibacteraceae bacterium MK1]
MSALTAFDAALLNAGAGNLNLLKVSSILPPTTDYHEDLYIPPGSLVPIAYGTYTSANKGETISAAVAVGLPEGNTFGVIMECSGTCTKEEITEHIKGMVKEAFEKREILLKEIKVAAVQHNVTCNYGSAFAGAILWY